MSEEKLPAPVKTDHSDKTTPAPTARRHGNIYTRFGDAGRTKLVRGVTVWKDDPRVQIYGTLDEATSAMGLARASTHHDDIFHDILDLQGELIGVMTELATPSGAPPLVMPVAPPQVERLERKIDAYEEERIATNQFVRPGGSVASAALDLARTIVRRSERLLVAANREEPVNPALMRYVNRLSDLLYVMARVDEQREIKQMVIAALTPTLNPRPVEARMKATLDLAICDRMVEAGIRRAREIGVPMVLAVVDDGGNLLELRRMDGALIVSIQLAPHKAYTAATIQMPTADLANLSQPGAPLYGIDVNIPNLTLVGGGLPVPIDGTVAGGVGVSGGSVEQDVDVAQAMLAAL